MVIEKLQAAKDFTTTEQALARYMLGHVDLVCGMTIRELGEAAFVSPSAITRLCQKLGLDGFNQLRVSLAAESSELNNKLRQIDANFPFAEGDSLKEIADNLALLSVQQILAAQQCIDYITMSKAVHAICARKLLCLFAEGISFATMQSFAERMTRIGYSTVNSLSLGMQRYYAFNADKTWFAIIASHSGLSKRVLSNIKHLHENGVPTLLITSNPISPMIPHATYLCCLSSAESLAMQDKIDCFGFPIALHYFLDCLFSMVFASNYERNLKRSKEANQEQFTL